MALLTFRWIMKKGTIEVTVREGNTELSDDSLVVSGYDVSGRVTSENEPVAGVSFILFGVRFLIIFLVIVILCHTFYCYYLII